MATTYKIGEAAALLNLKTYVLRFWETEFPQIAPLRTEKGQRLYTEEHLALLDRIRFLLHERGLTIEGARKVLAEEAGRGARYVRAHGPGQMPGDAPYDASDALPAENSPTAISTGQAPALAFDADARGPETAARVAPAPERAPSPLPERLVPAGKSAGLGVGFESVSAPGGPLPATPRPLAGPGVKRDASEQGLLLFSSSMEADSGDEAGPEAAEDAPEAEDMFHMDGAGTMDYDYPAPRAKRPEGAAAGPALLAGDAPAARRLLRDVTAELEAVAALLRGPSAGTPA